MLRQRTGRQSEEHQIFVASVNATRLPAWTGKALVSCGGLRTVIPKLMQLLVEVWHFVSRR